MQPLRTTPRLARDLPSRRNTAAGARPWSREVRSTQRTSALGLAPRSWPEWLERGTALALLVLAAPLIVLLGLFVLLVDGRPALYRGERLGRAKRPFLMNKIRTLRRGAELRTADRLLDTSDSLEIPGGRFLRDSRLDELPQLWNIVRGDMHFIGPRPERRCVYLKLCRDLPGYEQRFVVRPGLIGPSQLFTPHATHKRIRCWLDNAWCRRGRSASEIVSLTGYTAFVVTGKVAGRALEALRDAWQSRLLRRTSQRRGLRRAQPAGAVASFLTSDDTAPAGRGLLLDLSEEALCVRSSSAFSVGTPVRLRLVVAIGLGRGGRWKLRNAVVTGVVVALRPRAGAHDVVLRYTPSGARSHYVLHQYFLENSLALPRALRARRGASAAAPLPPTPADTYRAALARFAASSSTTWPTNPAAAAGSSPASAPAPRPIDSPVRARSGSGTRPAVRASAAGARRAPG